MSPPEGLAPPELALELLEDLTPAQPPGFLRLVRRRLLVRHPDGHRTRPFVYDEVDRAAIDAVVVVPHFLGERGREVYLRSCIRPPVHFRDPARDPLGELPRDGVLWEVPAGLVEPDEVSPPGLLAAAARELLEETGFEVAPARLRPLGAPAYPCAGVVAERHYLYEVEVDPAARREPPADGSPLEERGEVRAVPLRAALELARAGALPDMKTELALRRLAERYP